MTDEEHPSAEWEFDDEPVENSDGPSSTALFAVIATLLVVAIGSVGYLSGIGWFGYRQWMYGTGRIYLGNYTPETHFVSVDGREPVKLGPEKYEVVDLVGGTSTIRVMDADKNPVSSHAVTAQHSDAFLKVAGEPCLVVSDVSTFYGSGSGELEFLDFIRSDERVYVPGSYNVIWPGKDFPDRLEAGEGPGLWIEKVGCALLEDEDVMRKYLQVRLKDRMGPEQPTRMPPPGESR